MKLCCSSESGSTDLSGDDIVALRRLDRVTLENISGGARIVPRVGKPVVAVTYMKSDDLDAALELVNCPHVWQVTLAMSTEEMKRFTRIVPQLPRLRSVVLTISPALSFKDVEDVVMEAVKILRSCHDPNGSVLLWCGIPQHGEDAEELEQIKSKIASEGGAVEFNELEGVCMCTVKIKDSVASAV